MPGGNIMKRFPIQGSPNDPPQARNSQLGATLQLGGFNGLNDDNVVQIDLSKDPYEWIAWIGVGSGVPPSAPPTKRFPIQGSPNDPPQARNSQLGARLQLGGFNGLNDDNVVRIDLSNSPYEWVVYIT
jgi:phage gp37-like protein